jgi:hypothetical protein
MTGTVLSLIEKWYCPNCKREEIIPSVGGPHTRFHTCPKLRMLTAPMIPWGTKAKVVVHEREDYESEDAGYTTLDGNGRPVMNVETVRDEGNDLLVFAPTAHGSGEALGVTRSHVIGAGTATGTGSASQRS